MSRSATMNHKWTGVRHTRVKRNEVITQMLQLMLDDQHPDGSQAQPGLSFAWGATELEEKK